MVYYIEIEWVSSILNPMSNNRGIKGNEIQSLHKASVKFFVYLHIYRLLHRIPNPVLQRNLFINNYSMKPEFKE